MRDLKHTRAARGTVYSSIIKYSVMTVIAYLMEEVVNILKLRCDKQ